MFIGDEEVDVIGANRSGMVSVLLDRNDINNQYGQAHTIGSLFEVKSLI
jgi:FMN phosphatase YigB (HAD superfamily)